MDVARIAMGGAGMRDRKCRNGAGAFLARRHLLFRYLIAHAGARRRLTIKLGPGEPTQAHQTDEWYETTAIRQCAEIYRRLAGDLRLKVRNLALNCFARAPAGTAYDGEHRIVAKANPKLIFLQTVHHS